MVSASVSGRTFQAVNHARMGSNVYTVVNQGGGEKKAGFPYQVGRISWTSEKIKTCRPTSSVPCCTLGGYMTLRYANVCVSKPISSNHEANRFFKCSGLNR